MDAYITTYGGSRFMPTDPRAEDVHITDIAHALSYICRGNGHVKTFFSVGQHCLHCALEAEARGHSPRVVLACLLHDAAEAYMSDVPRPFKPYLTEYKGFEDRLLAVIYEKYLGSPLTAEEEALVKGIDDDTLYFNLRDLLNNPPEGPVPDMKTKFPQTFRPFEEVEREYLEIFEKYRKRI